MKRVEGMKVMAGEKKYQKIQFDIPSYLSDFHDFQGIKMEGLSIPGLIKELNHKLPSSYRGTLI